LTTRLGVLDGGRGGFVQDGSGGIALYLAEIPASLLPAGTLVSARGTVYDRYGQRTIRVDADGLVSNGEGLLPEAPSRMTGGIGEADEGSRIAAAGTLTATPDALADGTGLWIDDGSGPLRIVATPAALEGVSLRKRPLTLGRRAAGSACFGEFVGLSNRGYRAGIHRGADGRRSLAIPLIIADASRDSYQD
jgi:hypothetical protein